MSTEPAACAWIDRHSDELIELAAQLIRFDTTAVEPGLGETPSPAEDECQAFLADQLRSLGADVRRVSPDPARFREHPMMPPGHHWDGRAMTLAHLPGTGGGGSVILNGHIDVVDAGPAPAWSYPPFGGVYDDGLLYGRGAADMKGGIASMLFGLAALLQTGVTLAGDVWVQLVTDEETNGMGTVALLPEQPPADAAVIPEPSHFDAWVACRGVLYGRATIRGRAAHAELSQASWHEGGGVNAISKLALLLRALEELEAAWQHKSHPYLAAPTIAPTLVEGGDFIASIPRSCTLTVDATYLAADRDEDGYGSHVRAAIERHVDAALAQDDWLAAHPLEWDWTSDYPPYELESGERLLAAVATAACTLGLQHRPAGLNAWHDAATLGLFADTPAISCGPGRPEQAHTVDEAIAIDDLVAGAKLYALLIADLCGSWATRAEDVQAAP